MWNTWSRRTKATGFITKKTNSISTKRWKSSSTNICIPRLHLLRARPAQDQAKWQHRHACRQDICSSARQEHVDLSFDQGWRLIFRYSGVETAAQFAVAHAVKEINTKADDEPSKKASPGFKGQA